MPDNLLYMAFFVGQLIGGWVRVVDRAKWGAGRWI